MPALGGAAALPLRFLDYLIYEPIRTAKSSKDRLQARFIIEVMIVNWQHADLASAFTEAGDRGDHWRAAIRTSIANYDDDFQRSFRTELAKGVTELGANAANYDLANKRTK